MKPKQFFEAVPTPIEALANSLPGDPFGLSNMILRPDRLIKEAAIEIGCILHSAQIANNPNIVRSLQMEHQKKIAIEQLDKQDRECGRETDISIKLLDGRYAIRITPYTVLAEMRRLFPDSKIDIHAVERHLKAEAATGDLIKSSDKNGYIYQGFWSKLGPV